MGKINQGIFALLQQTNGGHIEIQVIICIIGLGDQQLNITMTKHHYLLHFIS